MLQDRQAPVSNGALPTKSSKPKTTPTLPGIGLFSNNSTPAPKKEEPAALPKQKEAVTIERLEFVWSEFAETRKNQIAEYQILKREFKFEHPTIMVTLTNPVEEPLLDNFKRDLLQYLRDTLKNSELDIATSLQESTGKKVVYTSKEKFEHLAEKNPKLWELKERLGLDWDI